MEAQHFRRLGSQGVELSPVARLDQTSMTLDDTVKLMGIVGGECRWVGHPLEGFLLTDFLARTPGGAPVGWIAGGTNNRITLCWTAASLFKILADDEVMRPWDLSLNMVSPKLLEYARIEGWCISIWPLFWKSLSCSLVPNGYPPWLPWCNLIQSATRRKTWQFHKFL